MTLTVGQNNRIPSLRSIKPSPRPLNLSPRNVVNVWQLATLPTPVLTRIQQMPQSITNLLP